MVGTIVAGCTGQSDAASTGTGPAPAPVFDGASGAISGTVTDEEAQPVIGAQVGIVSAGHQQAALTDDVGKFTLSNVPPGKYQLFAQRLGFEAAARVIEVREGEITEARFVLVAIEIREGFNEVWMKQGYFECSWTGVGGTGPCFFPYVGQSSTVPVDPWTNNKRQFDYVVREGVFTVTNELDWRQASYGTSEKLQVFLSYTNRTTAHRYCNGQGVPPVLLRWERGDAKDKEGTCATGTASLPSSEPKTIPFKGQNITSRVNVGSGSLPGTSAAISFQQAFEIHFGVFYWQAAPEGFTAVADK
ncbi:MAG TPA: carboxypeptidase-like regulatory domain-containing protein [Candidatus Thermoplasmatota archaeon]|nr:carboxypeptidase-like regulatory domain-containing protein [Candidatus Thermoplasmatota archaeon]